MNVFLNVCVTGSSLRRCRHAVQQVSWRRRGEAWAQCLCWPGSSSQPTVSSHTDGWVGLKFGCHDVWRMWFCAKHKTCAAAEKLWPANVVHTCQKEGASTRSGFFFKVFSLCFDLLYTLDIITGHWNRAFLKLLSWWRNCFQFCLLDGNKQSF